MKPPQSDRFYRSTRAIGRGVMLMTSSATVLHMERTRLAGRWILAANHVSPYDVAVIVRSCERVIDWVSIEEVWRRKLLGGFCERMGAFPIDRARLDVEGLRTIYDRLLADRVIGIFPEGGLATDLDRTILQGAEFRSGVGKIATMVDAPIIPCVHVGTRSLGVPHRWLPLRLQRYGIIFGEPLYPDPGLNRRERATELEARLSKEMQRLSAQLRRAGGWPADA